MKTPRILLTVLAAALIAQTTSFAQPVKYRAAVDRASDNVTVASAEVGEPSEGVRHRHRSGGASPRTAAASTEQQERGLGTLGQSENARIQVGPRSRSRVIVRGEVPAAEITEQPATMERSPGPPARRGGRR